MVLPVREVLCPEAKLPKFTLKYDSLDSEVVAGFISADEYDGRSRACSYIRGSDLDYFAPCSRVHSRSYTRIATVLHCDVSPRVRGLAAGAPPGRTTDGCAARVFVFVLYSTESAISATVFVNVSSV